MTWWHGVYDQYHWSADINYTDMIYLLIVNKYEPKTYRFVCLLAWWFLHMNTLQKSRKPASMAATAINKSRPQWCLPHRIQGNAGGLNDPKSSWVPKMFRISMLGFSIPLRMEFPVVWVRLHMILFGTLPIDAQMISSISLFCWSPFVLRWL